MTIAARRVGPSLRCAKDSVKTRYWEASSGLVELEHPVVFRHPEQRSSIQNNNGYRDVLTAAARVLLL